MDPIRKYLFLLLVIFLSTTTDGSGQNCIYPSSNLYVQNFNCSLTADLCLDIPFGRRNDYEVFVDGNLYAGAYSPCNYDTVSFYNLLLLKTYLDGTITEDMVVDSIRINGDLFSFSFTTLQGLADSIDLIDTTSDWTLSTDSIKLDHIQNNSTYSEIFFRDRTSNGTFGARFQETLTPTGMIIEISNGIHELVLNEIATTCRDTVTAEAFCLDNMVYFDTININEIDTICFTLDDLRGSLMSVENICPSKSGIHAMIDPLISTACIEITGLDVGIDTACLVLVDSEGLRDTIFYTVQVLQPIDQNDFFASNDDVTTNIDEPVVINPTMNDGIPNVLDTLFLVSSPPNGTATVNADGTISYHPDMGYESNGILDSLTYAICIMSDCRTATIFIDVVPPAIDIRSGFSPNHDGINDTFVIENLNRFPNNQLCVFNRWGNQVLQEENYQNNWDGTWDESTVLPDGTYFYVLDVEVDSEMQQYTGFVQLRR